MNYKYMYNICIYIDKYVCVLKLGIIIRNNNFQKTRRFCGVFFGNLE